MTGSAGGATGSNFDRALWFLNFRSRGKVSAALFFLPLVTPVNHWNLKHLGVLMIPDLKFFTKFGNPVGWIAIGSVMTSFLHFQTSSTGTQVPGGAFGTAGDAGRLKLVAPRGSESSPVPTSFLCQISARTTGGTAVKTNQLKWNRTGGSFPCAGKSRTVCHRAGRTGPTLHGRGAAKSAGPDTFPLMG
jgi:hypothetical protein